MKKLFLALIALAQLCTPAMTAEAGVYPYSGIGFFLDYEEVEGQGMCTFFLYNGSEPTIMECSREEAKSFDNELVYKLYYSHPGGGELLHAEIEESAQIGEFYFTGRSSEDRTLCYFKKADGHSETMQCSPIDFYQEDTLLTIYYLQIGSDKHPTIIIIRD